MKLSHAIRVGVRIRPQSTLTSGRWATYYWHEWPDGTVCSTAMGAAYEAVTGDLESCRPETVLRVFPYIKDRVINPENGKVEKLEDVIDLRLNEHGWNREEIADWVESIGY